MDDEKKITEKNYRDGEESGGVEREEELRKKWRQHEWHNIRGRTVTMRLLIKRPPRLRAQPTHPALRTQTRPSRHTGKPVQRYMYSELQKLATYTKTETKTYICFLAFKRQGLCLTDSNNHRDRLTDRYIERQEQRQQHRERTMFTNITLTKKEIQPHKQVRKDKHSNGIS